MSKEKFLDKKGFTIIELMSVVAASAALAVVFYSSYFYFQKQSQRNQLMIASQNAVNDLRSALSNKTKVLYNIQGKSAGKYINQDFYNCICGEGTCKATTGKPIDLIVADSGGAILSPQFYTQDGVVCTSKADPVCAISVSSKFIAVCGPDYNDQSLKSKATCDGIPVEFLAIQYTVESLKNPEAFRAKSGIMYIEASSYFEACQ